jgi:hypothetical protein
MLLVAAFAMSAIDRIGNVLFLRAVHPHQRMRMTPIFSTYRDVAQIVLPHSLRCSCSPCHCWSSSSPPG